MPFHLIDLSVIIYVLLAQKIIIIQIYKKIKFLAESSKLNFIAPSVYFNNYHKSYIIVIVNVR